ncbi:MAG: hypothetical protein IJP42_05480 [Selenomonadaceae bacterium]|nr:hypothetical protein [Selenomonadaceae bacterium]
MVNLDYLYNPDAAKPHLGKDFFIDKKLGFQVIENGTIFPYKAVQGSIWGIGGIFDSEGKFISSSFLREGYQAKVTPPRTDST